MQFLATSPTSERNVDAAASLVIYRLNMFDEDISGKNIGSLILDFLDTFGEAPLADNAITSFGYDRIPETDKPVALNYFVAASPRLYAVELDTFYGESPIDLAKLHVAGFPAFYSFDEIKTAFRDAEAFFDPDFFLQDWLVEIDLDMLGSSDPDYVETLVDYG